MSTARPGSANPLAATSFTSQPDPVKPILVLGLGNLLLGDDGFGPTLVERLGARYPNHPSVDFIDGGTIGLGLLSLLSGRQSALLLDAFRAGQPPGSLHIYPHFQHDSAGPLPERNAHASNAASLLAVAALTGDLPPRLALLGMEPASIATGIGLSLPLQASLPAAEQHACLLLQDLIETHQASEAPLCA